MKKLFKSFLILSAIAMAIPCFAQTPNTLTKKEKKAGWELLFNGKDFSGWRQCNGTAMPANWVIEDNAMKVLNTLYFSNWKKVSIKTSGYRKSGTVWKLWYK